MGRIVKSRKVEEHYDGLNVTYFLLGENPKPDILVDDVEGVYYQQFAINIYNEKMYIKRNF